MFEPFARQFRWLGWLVLALLGLFFPVMLGSFWIELGTLIFATSIGAIGLMLLFGRVGQLSLGHPFFLAIGAYAYIVFASPSTGFGQWGFGLPSIAGILAAALLAALGGLLVSPIASRVRGLSLGLATLALTFVGEWILTTFYSLSGGYTGRTVPALQIGPFSSSGSDTVIAGLSIGPSEFLWYVTLVLLIAVSAFTANLLNGRVGRAFTAIRDAEVHAQTLGVEVARYRALAFVISTAYAGLAGALYVIIIRYVVPNYWDLGLALSYLAMIVIGGMRSISGAILGATFVTALPALLQRYGHALPIFDNPTGPSVLAHVLYGVIVVVILIFEPLGLVELLKRAVARIFPRAGKTHEHVDTRPEGAAPSEPNA